MKSEVCRCCALIATVILMLPCPANSADAEPKPPGSVTNRVTFKAVAKGAPSVRVTGGSRGLGDAAITLDVLAPDETGLTTQEQPSLFWYQSKPAMARFELTLLDEKTDKPLLQIKLDRSEKAGIQRVRLSDHGVKLVAGVEYQWVVSLVTDPGNRSSDLVASGAIQRIEASPDLKQKLSKAQPSALPGVYAEAGIWHDALASLSDQIEAQPDNKALRETRSNLLTQVGLKAAASAEGAPAKNQ